MDKQKLRQNAEFSHEARGKLLTNLMFSAIGNQMLMASVCIGSKHKFHEFVPRCVLCVECWLNNEVVLGGENFHTGARPWLIPELVRTSRVGWSTLSYLSKLLP